MGSRSQTHCKHGHEFTEKNTRLYKPRRHPDRIFRQCKACHSMRERGYYRNDEAHRLRQCQRARANYYRKKQSAEGAEA